MTSRSWVVVSLVCGMLAGYSRAGEPAAPEPAPVVKADDAAISQWINELGHDEFARREAAADKLVAAGAAAIERVATAAKSEQPEVRMRAVHILKKLAGGDDSVVSGAARQALEKLAASADADAARLAKGALAPRAEPADPYGEGDEINILDGGLMPRAGAIGIKPRIVVRAMAGVAAGVRTVQVTLIDGKRTIKAEADGNRVEIADGGDEGIKMSVTKKVDGKSTTTKYEAKDVAELKSKHPEAHKLYKKYADKEGVDIRIEGLEAAIEGLEGGKIGKEGDAIERLKRLIKSRARDEKKAAAKAEANASDKATANTTDSAEAKAADEKRAESRDSGGRSKMRAVPLAGVLALALCGCGGGHESPAPDLVWGCQGSGEGQFQKPRALAIDADDRVYTVDMRARIQVYDTDGRFLRGWRTPDSKNGRPTGLSIDRDGSLLVADTHYYQVLSYTADGSLHRDRTLGGRLGSAPGEFGWVTDAVRDSRGNLYVAEYGEWDRIQKFSASGKFLLQWGGHGSEPGQFRRPQSLAIDERDRIWVADSCNHRIQVFDATGDEMRLVSNWGEQGDQPGKLRYPYSLALDGKGHVYVCEWGNHRVQKFTLDGHSLAVWGTCGRGEGELNNPWAVALDSRGRLYILDSGNHRVIRINL